MNPKTIRQGFKDAIGDATGANFTSRVVLAPTVPAIMVIPTDIPGTATYEGKYDLDFELLLLVSSNEMDGGQDTLDDWLSTDAATSISAALAHDETLGGNVESARYNGMVPNSYGPMSLSDGGTVYLTARVAVNVFA